MASPPQRAYASFPLKVFAAALSSSGAASAAAATSPMRCAAFAAAASCSGVSRRSSASSASAVSCSGVLTSGFSGEIAVLAVHPIGATAANGTAPAGVLSRCSQLTIDVRNYRNVLLP